MKNLYIFPNQKLNKATSRLPRVKSAIGNLLFVTFVFFQNFQLQAQDTSITKKYLIKKDWQYESSGILDSTHLRFFTKKSIKRLFEEQGFEIIAIKGLLPVKSAAFYLFNILTLGFFQESAFLQWAIKARKRAR